MSFPRYLKYKDSGVEWLGEVPEHWEIKRLKHIAAEKPFAIVDGPFGTQLKAEDYRDSGVPLVRISNLSYDGRFSSEDLVFIEQAKADEVCRSSIVRGDVVVGKTGATIGKSALFDYCDYGIIASSCLKITPDAQEMSSRFLLSTIVSGSFQRTLVNESGGSTRDTINITPFGNLQLAAPPLIEQSAIADFLDRETAKIDELVAEQRRLMELLKEKRQAVISHAVTQGLNPNVPMKPSGIEWLGDVPGHWEVIKAKRVSSIFVPQRNKPELNTEGNGLHWVTMDQMRSEVISGAELWVSESAAYDAGTRVLKAGAVVASCVGTFGLAAVNEVDVIINQQLQAFVPSDEIEAKFLMHCVVISKGYFEQIGTAATIAYVNQLGFANLPIALPPKNEQHQIVVFVADETAKFDTLTTEAQHAIDLLQERRSALISAAVTGQIDVRQLSPAQKVGAGGTAIRSGESSTA